MRQVTNVGKNEYSSGYDVKNKGLKLQQTQKVQSERCSDS